MSEAHRPGIAILSSGSGSTLEAFVHACEAGIVDAEVGLVVSNSKTKGSFRRVERLNRQYGLDIQTLHVNGVTHPAGAGESGEMTLQESAAIANEIEKHGIAFVCLMGYMKKVRGALLQQYGWQEGADYETARMLNTHPGPLPQTEGMHSIHVQEEVINSGLGYSAQTLHVVAAEYDRGPIIAEHRVPVLPDDTPESLFESVQLTEKTHLPADIGQFLEDISNYGQ
jgi:phosphoribosylglycinamide formyltransferase-1